MTSPNETFFQPSQQTQLPRAYYKNWYVKLNDLTGRQSLWLRFTVLSTSNGFKRVAETWAIFFQRLSGREVKKVAIKQTYDLSAFLGSENNTIRIGGCELLPHQTRGLIQSKGQSIQWDLKMGASQVESIRFVPDILSKTGLVKNSVVTLCEELAFSGTTTVNGETFHWDQAPGMQGYFDGSKNRRSWVWAHCNTFVDETGKRAPFIFEGICAKTPIGPLFSPRLSSLYFHYLGKNYHFNTLMDAFYIKAKHGLNEWSFQADRDDVSFRGQIQAEHNHFAGLTLEDTNGSLLYSSSTEAANMTICIYRKGKLESTLKSNFTTAFEVVSREKNPYVNYLV